MRPELFTFERVGNMRWLQDGGTHQERSLEGGRYVFVHILVMEEMLGRYLVPGESVHDRNGARDDNRPENLELWTRPQPSGTRASDALEWARQIIETYDGAGSTSNNVQDLS